MLENTLQNKFIALRFWFPESARLNASLVISPKFPAMWFF